MKNVRQMLADLMHRIRPAGLSACLLVTGLLVPGPDAGAQFTIPGDDSANYRMFNGEHHIKEDSQWYRYNPKSKLMDPLKNGSLTIRFNDNLDSAAQAAFAAENHLTRTFYFEEARYIEYRYDSFATNGIFDIAETIKSSPVVSYVRLNRYTQLHKAFNDPNKGGDPPAPSQWHIVGNTIGLASAWTHIDRRDFSTSVTGYGSPTVKIGFPDWGYQWDHGDLAHSVYRNVPEAWSNEYNPGTGDNVDADANGLMDDYKGWNFTAGGSNDVRLGVEDHGTSVIGTVGMAVSSGNYYHGIAGGDGSSPGCQLIPFVVSGDIGTLDASAVTQAIYYSVSKGAKTINLSLGYPNGEEDSTSVLDFNEALRYAYSKGVIITAAAGNRDSLTAPPDIYFPTHSPYVTVVTGFGPGGDYGFDNLSKYDANHSFICAPSHSITTTSLSGYASYSGTSYAAPMVAGVLGLMESVNKNISLEDRKTILRLTALKIGTDLDNPPPDRSIKYYAITSNPGYSEKAGYGYLDGGRAVQTAYDVSSDVADLYIKDHRNDIGLSARHDGYNPNDDTRPYNLFMNTSDTLYIDELRSFYDDCENYIDGWYPETDNSPDIWVRNQADGIQEHENPVYQFGQPVYIYVRVRNKSDLGVFNGAKVKLYWSRAATNSSWPAHWDGSGNSGSQVFGDYIGELPVGVLLSGTDKVLGPIEWYPNAAQTTLNPCLLARIEYTDPAKDPIVPLNGLYNELVLNNNIAMKNLTIVPTGGGPIKRTGSLTPGGYVRIGNASENDGYFSIRLGVPNARYGAVPDITKQAFVRFFADSAGMAALQASSSFSKLVTAQKVFPMDSFVVIMDPEVQVDSVFIPAGHFIESFIGFNFRIDKDLKGDTLFRYRINQAQHVGNKGDLSYLGSESFEVYSSDTSFSSYYVNASADEETIFYGDSTILRISTNLPNPDYNWYRNGVLISKDSILSVSPGSTQLYSAEVFSLDNGNFGSKQLSVQVLQGRITLLYPNPAATDVTIDYMLHEVSSASLRFYDVSTGLPVQEVPLSLSGSSINVAVGSLPAGVYNVALFCDGLPVDSRTFNKL